MSETFDAAQEALETALPVEPDQPVSDQTSQVIEPTTEVPSSSLDLSGLPEEAQVYLRAREREMQAHSTKTWQEAAEAKREAEQSLAFINALNSDPNFALQVASHLQQELARAGFVEQPQHRGYDDDFDDLTYDDDSSGPDPYQADIAEIKRWQQNLDHQIAIGQMSAKLEGDLARVRTQHPEWDDEDIGSVIDLGFATAGDIIKAADLHQSNLDRALTRYLERKGQSVSPPQVRSTSGTPVVAEPKTDDELRAAALERIRAELG